MPNLESTKRTTLNARSLCTRALVSDSTWWFLEHRPSSEQQIRNASQTLRILHHSACLREGCYDLRAYFKSYFSLTSLFKRWVHFRTQEAARQCSFYLTLRSIGAKPTVSSNFLFSELWAGLSQSYSTSGLDKSRQNVQIHSPLKKTNRHIDPSDAAHSWQKAFHVFLEKFLICGLFFCCIMYYLVVSSP